MGAPIAEPDLELLARNVALARLAPEDLARVYALLDQRVVTPGTVVVREGELGDDMYFVLEGSAAIERRGLELKMIGPGEHFGEIGLLGRIPRAATITAQHPLRLARLTHAAYQELARTAPATALRLHEGMLAAVAGTLVAMTDSVNLLLGERLVPRRTDVTVTLGGATRTIPTGTRAAELFPAEVEGHLVVACLLDARPVSLRTPVLSDAHLAPLTLGSPDGREIYRRSAGLLLLEAARRVLPEVVVRLGPALDTAQRIVIETAAALAEPLPVIAGRLRHMLDHLIAQRCGFREEVWTVEVARAELLEDGWADAAAALETWREATVPIVRCGGVSALRTEPVVPDAGLLEGITVEVIPEAPDAPPPGNGGGPHEVSGLALVFGARGAHRVPPGGTAGELEVEGRAPRWGGDMVAAQRPWHRALGITSVGEFNRSCISGKVTEIIRVAEGFHEKRLGRLADAIATRPELRVISIAGPSSSGKTTLIKRLITQLEVVGLRPHAVSLDDYYVDRERTPREATGEYDFEALEALDLPTLRTDVQRLLRGERVCTPRYDFKLGKSLPCAGPELQLEPGAVLLLEGIHGLNPALLGPAVPAAQQFRVFIHPAMGLPIDRLSRVSPYDLRLLRRIVRDRHTRNISAAENIVRWRSVRRGETLHIYPFLPFADAVFDSSLVYEPAVIKVYAERYLLEVPSRHPAHMMAHRLRQLVDRFVAIYPEHVPPTSILREFIGGSGFEY